MTHISLITHKEKSSIPPILDYFTILNEHKYYPINLFEAVDWFKCIANVHQVDQRSELEKEVGMFCRDWLTHHRDPSVQYLDTSFDDDMEKVYESDVYIQVRNLVKTFDEDTVVALKRFINVTPMTEQVFKFEMNWAVVDKVRIHFYFLFFSFWKHCGLSFCMFCYFISHYEEYVLVYLVLLGLQHKLHEKLRPWISIIINNSAYEGGNTIVSNILESLKSHGSASSILENEFYFKKVINEADSEMLFLKMWKMIFFEINKLVQGTSDMSPAPINESFLSLSVDGNNPLGVETFNDTTTKLKEWALSVEINWAVFDQHELHEKMSPWIRKEVIKLLKKEKASVVDEVIDAIRKQNSASQMLELLAPSLEDDTEFVVKTLWRTLLILVNILETDPVWNSEESSDCVVGVIKRNRGYDYTSILRQMKMLDFEMLCEANRLKGIIPRNIGKLSFYQIDWAVSDKEELHNRLRPWIFRWIMEFVGPEKVAISVVDSIVAKIKEHANVKAIFELVKPSLGERSSIFVLVLWTKLIWQIQLAGMTAGHPVIDGERSTVEISEYGDRYSRNRHFMFDAFDYENLLKLKQISEAMPKTKEDLFSCEIKWDVYEKHGLQKTMWEGICAETLELTRQKQDAAGLAFDQIMWSIFDYHVSASRREFDAQKEAVMVVEEIMSRLNKYHASPYEMMEFLEPIFGSSGSEKLVMKMWYALVCSIKIAEAGVEKKLPPGWGSAVLLPDKTRR
ncbi:hypothetical protein MKX03_015776 [Papaver bracteatum]|nr:hypothetical protein MKX03_015776 [Papaver bracteatum]